MEPPEYRQSTPHWVPFNINYNTLLDVLQVARMMFNTVEENGNIMILNIGGTETVLNRRIASEFITHLHENIVVAESEFASDPPNMVRAHRLDPYAGIMITLVPQRRRAPAGAFFRFQNNSGLDLSRYQIFDMYQLDSADRLKDRKCFFFTFDTIQKEKGYEVTVNPVYMTGEVVKRQYLNKIARDCHIKLILHYYDGTGRKKYERYGAHPEKTIDIALYQNHYFIYETLEDKIDPSNRQPFTSLSLIRRLFNNDYFEPMHSDNLLEKQITVPDHLIIIEPEGHHFRAINKKFPCISDDKRNTQKQICYFDFECNTEGAIHQAYMVCFKVDNSPIMVYEGEDCAHSFINYIVKNAKTFTRKSKSGKVYTYKCVVLYAHNLGYDLTFLLKHLGCGSYLGNGNMCKGYRCHIRGVELIFKDSFSFLASKLEKIPKMFKMDELQKEIMPFKAYTRQNVEKRFVSLNEIRACEEQWSEKKWKKFLEVAKPFCGDGIMDMMKYARFYCSRDVEVLSECFEKFRELCKDSLNLDIHDCYTIPSVAMTYMTSVVGAFDGVLKIGWSTREFIQKTIKGGRVMTRNNHRHCLENCKLIDMDARSLYPTAMKLMQGVLRGKAKPIPADMTTKEILSKDGYFVEILIKRVPKWLPFPRVSHKTEDGIIEYSNSYRGLDYVCKPDLEAYMKYHEMKPDVDFQIIRGLYYDEGRNPVLSNEIVKLYAKRTEYKKEGNPIQEVFKLIMNTVYGKMGQKPVNQRIEVVKDYDEYINKILYRSDSEIVGEVGNGYWIVKDKVPKADHFNMAHCASEILAIARNIMSDLYQLCDQMNIKIYYQDTDSAHMEQNRYAELCKEWKRLKGYELDGPDMGQFHPDFELPEKLVKKGEKCMANPYSCRAIFLGKKSYIHEVVYGFNEDESEKTFYHFRMKGIPQKSIELYAKENEISIWQIYRNLHNGHRITFNLLYPGAVRFDRNKDLSITSRSAFQRDVQF